MTPHCTPYSTYPERRDRLTAYRIFQTPPNSSDCTSKLKIQHHGVCDVPRRLCTFVTVSNSTEDRSSAQILSGSMFWMPTVHEKFSARNIGFTKVASRKNCLLSKSGPTKFQHSGHPKQPAENRLKNERQRLRRYSNGCGGRAAFASI